MTTPIQRYADIIRARAKTTDLEQGYSCLCCRDTGAVTPENVRRYSLAAGEFDGYDEHFISDTLLLCQRIGCKGNQVEITTDSGTKMVERLASYALRFEAKPDICRWVHDQEIQRLRAQHETLSDAAVLPTAVTATPKPPAQRKPAQFTSIGETLNRPEVA